MTKNKSIAQKACEHFKREMKRGPVSSDDAICAVDGRFEFVGRDAGNLTQRLIKMRMADGSAFIMKFSANDKKGLTMTEVRVCS